jgi:DeoR family transcriptional regulator, suf operon transcriptional repressor
MLGTREHVLQFLVDHREARVEEMADAFGITTAAVRRHLDNLRADGLVDARAVKQATGRPYYAYHATERARGSIPQEYADLMARVLQSVEDRGEMTEGVASRMAESVALRHRDEMAVPGDARARVAMVTDSLRQEGILQSWHAEHDGFHLVNGTCPYRQAAEVSKLPCESDRKTIELLLGEDVIQLNRIVDGASVCEYLVQAPAGHSMTEETEAVR